MTVRISNLERIGSVRSTLSLKLKALLQFPLIGLAAAITLHLAQSEVTIPALDIEMDYYSIASWMEVLSWSFILSNSSIKHTPLSANTRAPPSRVHSPLTGSLWTPAVRPTALAPLPVVQTHLWKTYSTYLRNWDLAVPGSPSKRQLISPLILCFPSISLASPPNIQRAKLFLIKLWPQIEGAIELKILQAMWGFLASAFMACLSSSVSSTISSSPNLLTKLASITVWKTGNPCFTFAE